MIHSIMTLLRRIVKDNRRIFELEDKWTDNLQPAAIPSVIYHIFEDKVYHLGRFRVAAEFIRLSCVKFPDHQEKILQSCEAYFNQEPHGFCLLLLELEVYGVSSTLWHRIFRINRAQYVWLFLQLYGV